MTFLIWIFWRKEPQVCLSQNLRKFDRVVYIKGIRLRITNLRVECWFLHNSPRFRWCWLSWTIWSDLFRCIFSDSLCVFILLLVYVFWWCSQWFPLCPKICVLTVLYHPQFILFTFLGCWCWNHWRLFWGLIGRDRHLLITTDITWILVSCVVCISRNTRIHIL